MNKERLKTGLEMMGVAADETALDRFEAFHAILDEYNARMDLTAVLDEDERVDRHDLDSAAPLAHGLLAQGAKVIDVGTGAGFPGMPLLILRPDLQITFLDALNKRILFLEDALKRLGLTAATLHARAEDAAKMAAHREQYDAAVSRAVANAATLEELTLPFVKKGGVAIAWKGPGVAEEMTAARRAAFLLGGTVRGTVDAPIGRHPTERKRMAVTPEHSRPARTHYEVLAEYPGYSHLRLRLETGRTHQIRVHMAYIGHPLAGDPVYGPRRVITSLGGQCLHAGEIGFIHPRTGAEMRFEAPLPPYFTSFLHTCREKKR